MMPPQMMPPPGWMPPNFQPPRQRGGFARAVFTTLATTVLGLSIALNVYLLIYLGISSGQGLQQDVLRRGDPAQKVAVLPVKGVIDSRVATQFVEMLQEARNDVAVKAIVVEVDTPGGDVTASDVIYRTISNYRRDYPSVPVVISQGGLATSGGYYVSVAGDHIFAQPTTLTGNIGVLMPGYNLHQLFERWGITETTIESSGADFKNAGSMFKPEDPLERAYFQSIADAMFEQFKTVIVEGRGSRFQGDIDAVANGKVYVAKEAKELTLIDDIGYLNDAWNWAAQKASLTNPHVVRFERAPTLSDLLSAQSDVSPTANGGVNIRIDAELIDRLATPRVMYLWTGR